MPPPELRRKLQLSDEQGLTLLGAPDSLLGDLAGIDAADPAGVLAFAATRADVEAYADRIASAAGAPGGVAWVAYPKGSSGVRTDLARDHGWNALAERGLRPVRQVSLDSTWSALRFRRGEHVKSR